MEATAPLAIRVFSTYVEVILSMADQIAARNSILHVCGGDPKQETSQPLPDKYSPRMWR